MKMKTRWRSSIQRLGEGTRAEGGCRTNRCAQDMIINALR